MACRFAHKELANSQGISDKHGIDCANWYQQGTCRDGVAYVVRLFRACGAGLLDRKRKICCTMTSLRNVALSGLLTLALVVLASGVPARADSSGPFGLGNLFGGSGDAAATEEAQAAAQKAEKIKADDALLDQLTPADLFVSPEAAQRLQEAIAFYQRIVDAGGWPTIKKGETLHPGDQDEVVATLRKRLAISGDLTKGVNDDWILDAHVQAALIHFQRRHGLPPNGGLDVRTVYALNVPAEERLNQLRVSLARMQEFVARGLPDRYVMVNIPAMELQAVDEGRIALKSRVIVGRLERQTPGVAAKIQGLNFFPYWKVPVSIAFKDLIPKLGKDPEYLTHEHIRVLSDPAGQEIDPHTVDWTQPQFLNIRFRQDPGDFNALGVVRVDMPNSDDVYMHDTPLKDLFRRPQRAFSAGCVRVQRILDLVTWLAGTNGDWDRARVDSTLAARTPVDVKLNKPIPVYFIYQTAWVDTEMGIAFRSDLYDRDGTQPQAGAREASEPLPQQALAP